MPKHFSRVPGAFQHLLIGQLALALHCGIEMLGLSAEFTIFAAPAHLRGDDGAEFHIPAHVLDANFVRPIK
jgi:hypothetical protein